MSTFWIILIILIILVLIGWLWVYYSTPEQTNVLHEPEQISYIINNSNKTVDINIVDSETNNSVLKSQLDTQRKFDILYGDKSYIIKYQVSAEKGLKTYETVYNANKEVLVVDIKDNVHSILRIIPSKTLSLMHITVRNLANNEESSIKVTFNKKSKVIKMFNMQDDHIDRYHSEYINMKKIYDADIIEEMFGQYISQGLTIDA